MLQICHKTNITQIQNKSCFTLLPNGLVIFFGAGKRDNFCTYIGKPVWNPQTGVYDTMCATVTDDFYFSVCKDLVKINGVRMIYMDHLTGIYNQVTNVIDQNVVQRIFDSVTRSLSPEVVDSAILAYMLIYYGMVAEENYGVAATRQRPVCGKVIKMAGLYKHLVQDVSLGTASNPGACHCYVGMNPQAILQDAAAMGIHRDYVIHKI